MTVVPFAARRRDRTAGSAHLPSATPVTGSSPSPRGSAGTFTGTYRLERLVDQYGQAAAAGIFTGELTDGTGRPLGASSRRHTAAVELHLGAGGVPRPARAAGREPARVHRDRGRVRGDRPAGAVGAAQSEPGLPFSAVELAAGTSPPRRTNDRPAAAPADAVPAPAVPPNQPAHPGGNR